MDLYSGVDANGNLETTSYDWHHDDQKNAVNIQNATNALNVGLARYQNQWNLEQWQREMEWNSPANQVELLKAAGLNPLFYGQGLGANSTTQAPQSADMSVAGDFYQSQEQAKMANVVAALSSLGDRAGDFIKQKELQLASLRLDQDIQESRSRVVGNYAQSNLVKAQTWSAINGLKLQDANYGSILQGIAESQSRINQINEAARSGKLNNDFLEKTFDERVKGVKFQNDEVKARIDNLVKDTFLKGKQGDLVDIQTEVQKIVRDNEEFQKLPERAKGMFFAAAIQYLNKDLQIFSDAEMDALFEDFKPGRSTRNPSDEFDDSVDAVTGAAPSWSASNPDWSYRMPSGASRSK